MGRKPERTRYFVGTKGSEYTAQSVAVDIGSPEDRAAPEAYRRRFKWDVIEEVDLMGYADYIRKHGI